jgi:hypothetical protein
LLAGNINNYIIKLIKQQYLTFNPVTSFEFNYRVLFTDYLDDVSTPKYATNALLAAGQLEAASLSFRGDELDPTAKPPLYRPRGNPHNKDSYYSFQVTFSGRLNNFYLFGKDYISPAVGPFIPRMKNY